MMYTGEEAKDILEEILSNEVNGRYPLHEGDTGYYKEKVGVSDKFVAFDNATCDCWVEEFQTKKQAVSWIENGY